MSPGGAAGKLYRRQLFVRIRFARTIPADAPPRRADVTNLALSGFSHGGVWELPYWAMMRRQPHQLRGGVAPASHRIKGGKLIATGPSTKEAALAAPREFWGGNVQDNDERKRTRRTQM
jgi:hypothetical protein